MTVAVAQPANAQRAGQEEEAPDDGVDRTFSTEIGEIALKAQEEMETDPGAALQTINRGLERDASPYERYTLLRMRGSANYDLDRVPQAVADWQEALALNVATPQEASDLNVNIGQLLILSGEVERGAAILENWLANNPPKETVLMTLAQALAQADQERRALPYAEQAFEMASPKERKHFDLLNYLYNALNMPERQADIIREMLNRWPDDKNLWNGWVSMLSQGDRAREAFEVNKLMYVNGMLTTSDDVLRLVQYYSFFEVPFRGAQILEREMNAGRVEATQTNTELLINLWRQSREYDRAIPALREAAARSSSGELFEQLCEAHYSEGEYSEAEQACQQAIQKGGLEAPGNDWVLIGNSRYERGQREGALEAFERGLDYSHSRSTARGWIDFINGEIAAEKAREDFAKTVEREECIITIERIRRDDVLGDRGTEIPERCRQYEVYVE